MCAPQCSGACREESLLGPPGRRAEAPASPAGVALSRLGVDEGRRGPPCTLCGVMAHFLRPQSQVCGRHNPATSPAIYTPLISIFLEVALSQGGISPCPADGRLPPAQPGVSTAHSAAHCASPHPGCSGPKEPLEGGSACPWLPTCPPSPLLSPPKLGFFSEPGRELARA